MATTPRDIQVEIHPTFILARPGDTLIIGVDPETYGRMTDVDKYGQEQMLKNRLPGLKDAILIPATAMAVFTPDPE